MLTLVLPDCGRPLSMNERTHWAARKRRLAPYRAAVLQELNKFTVGNFLSPDVKGKPSVVRTVIGVKDKRKRDPHNYMWVTKTIVDALVEWGMWPDDDPEWLTVMAPELHVSTDTVVEIWERDEGRLRGNFAERTGTPGW